MLSVFPAPKTSLAQTSTFVGSRILGVLGLASIVESAKIWAGFLREVVTLYQQWLRQPLHDTMLLLWPSAIPLPPKYAADVFLVWACFFAAANYHVMREGGKGLFRYQLARASHNPMRSILSSYLEAIARTIILFFIGPPLFLFLAACNGKSAERHKLIITPWNVLK